MAMIQWDEAWRRFATPLERATAKLSGVSPEVAQDVIERAKGHGCIVSFKPRKRRRR